MVHFRVFVALSAPVFSTACDQDITCPAWSFPAVAVQLKSATSGEAIIGALGEVRDGQYRDSLIDSGDGGYTAAENRAGTYAVHVERQGYLAWDTTGIEVLQVGGSCPTVETEIFEVRLAPAQ
jgi:hypothetical protein